MAAAGMLYNIMLSVVHFAQLAGWPDLSLWGFSFGAGSLATGLLIALLKIEFPSARELKWSILRGCFAAGSVVSMIFAVRLGISLGDFAALNGVNVVVAACLGRLFLQEPFHWVHSVAVLCSLFGAVFISKPELIFSEGIQAAPWFAYFLALVSGCFDACVCICARVSANVSPVFMSSLTLLICCPVMFGCVPLANASVGLDYFVSSPGEGLTWMGVLTFLTICCSACFSLGSQWCPASASATVDTATRMVFGYGLELLLFTGKLDALKLVGAALMFAAVCLMALSPQPKSTPVASTPEPQTPQSVDPNATFHDADDASETESLASFVASEFVSSGVALRFRRAGVAEGVQVAQTIGSSAMTSVVTSI